MIHEFPGTPGCTEPIGGTQGAADPRQGVLAADQLERPAEIVLTDPADETSHVDLCRAIGIAGRVITEQTSGGLESSFCARFNHGRFLRDDRGFHFPIGLPLQRSYGLALPR